MEDSLILRHLQENCIRILAALPCHYLAPNIYLSQQLQSVHIHTKSLITKIYLYNRFAIFWIYTTNMNRINLFYLLRLEFSQNVSEMDTFDIPLTHSGFWMSYSYPQLCLMTSSMNRPYSQKCI